MKIIVGDSSTIQHEKARDAFWQVSPLGPLVTDRARYIGKNCSMAQHRSLSPNVEQIIHMLHPRLLLDLAYSQIPYVYTVLVHHNTYWAAPLSLVPDI
jgi:hypothetical protein